MVKIIVDGQEIETEREMKKILITSEWISVKDKLPLENEEVLYCVVSDIKRDIFTGHRQRNLWFHRYMFYGPEPLSDMVEVTHWMPLPDYPHIPQNECSHKIVEWDRTQVICSIPPQYKGECSICGRILYTDIKDINKPKTVIVKL